MIPQRTAEWVKARVGNLGASMMPTVMLPNNKDGTEKEKKTKLRKQIVAERLTGYAVDHYVTPAMQHGIDHEADAVAAYEAISGNLVAPGAWVAHPNLEYAGSTPDGFIDDEGLIECKCPTTGTHMDWILGKELPPDYRPQMAFQLICTRRLWCDFVSFDPRMPPKQRLFIRRFSPTAEYLAEVESAAARFLKEVDELFEAVTSAEAA